MVERRPASVRPRARNRSLLLGAAASLAALSLIGATPSIAAGAEAPAAALAPAAATKAEPVSFFPDGTVPAVSRVRDSESVELGMRFTPKVAGTVSAVKFYKTWANTGPHTATLWDGDGDRLATVRFANETSNGWQTAQLTEPVTLRAGSEYVVSYLARVGRYPADREYFASAKSTAYLSAPAGAGVFVYGRGGFPTETYRDSNYYVDVEFTPATSTGATPAPTPTPTTTPAPAPTTSPSPTPSPTATPAPTTPATSILSLPTEAWWGGSSYYGQFPKANAAGWDEASFFPIAVFFGKPSHASALASVGVNTYMGAEHDGASMTSITDQGIDVLAQDEWTAAEIGGNPNVVGYHVSDECEMGYSECTPDWGNDNGEYGRLAVQQSKVDALTSRNDGRFLQANFGNGVLSTYWGPNTMDDHVALMDATSVDKYAYTSPGVQELLPTSPYWPAGKNPKSAGAYGWLQDRMETFASPVASKPNWVFVETARPLISESDGGTITGDQIEGAVWNAIIHGAAGIAYFQHNNNEQCGMYSLVECSDALKSKVRAVNASVKSLAAVINTPSYVWRFGDGLETSLKASGGYAYVFAMTDGGTGQRTLKLPAGVNSQRVEVVGENRILTASNGAFSDSFSSENDHHIYKIQLAAG